MTLTTADVAITNAMLINTVAAGNVPAPLNPIHSVMALALIPIPTTIIVVGVVTVAQTVNIVMMAVVCAIPVHHVATSVLTPLAILTTVAAVVSPAHPIVPVAVDSVYVTLAHHPAVALVLI